MVISFMYYVNLYLIGSFMGFIHETLLKVIFFPSLRNGLLHGPWIPIYGFGFLMIAFSYRKICFWRKSQLWKAFVLFFILFFSLMILEELGGIMIELIFHQTFWSYSKLPFHIGPYISLEICVIWGIMSFFIVFYVIPFLELFLKKIPILFSISILFLQIIDFFSVLLS